MCFFPLYGQGIGEYVQYSDSINKIINDFSLYIDDIEMEQLLVQYRSKGYLSEKAVFSITGDPYISYILSKYAERDKLSLSCTGIMYSDPHALAFTADGMFNIERHSSGIIVEMDREENNALDNVKAFYSLMPHIIAGNIRVKTGRGLLCEYADYYSPLSTPFNTMRFEGDISKSEYPAFRGLGIILPLYNIRFYGILSYNAYDSSLDSIGNVHRILQYNVHDDSLSISRKDNLTQYSALAIMGMKNNYINIGFLYNRFSRHINIIDSKQILNAALFGSSGLISYDIAAGSNGGYALSCALKKTYSREITVKLSYLLMRNYFNTQCKFAAGDTNHIITSSIRLHKPVGILYEGIFDIERDNITHYVTYYPTSVFNIRFHYDQTKNDISMRFRLRSIEQSGIILFNTMKLNSCMSLILRSDMKLSMYSFNINAFAYYYNISPDDMISEYEYTVPGVYALHNLYQGNGMRFGLGLMLDLNRGIMLHTGAVYDTDNTFKLCINAEISI